MEDALRVGDSFREGSLAVVLILVLMEDALRVTLKTNIPPRVKRLNPCSNGRCSASYPHLHQPAWLLLS